MCTTVPATSTFLFLLRCGLRSRCPESRKEYNIYKLCLGFLYQCSLNFIVTGYFTACSSKYFLLYLLRRGMRPSIQNPEMPRPTKDSAHVTNTGAFQENSIVLQDSSHSDQEMEVQNPPSFQPSTVKHNPLWSSCLCLILWAKDGLHCE